MSHRHIPSGGSSMWQGPEEREDWESRRSEWSQGAECSKGGRSVGRGGSRCQQGLVGHSPFGYKRRSTFVAGYCFEPWTEVSLILPPPYIFRHPNTLSNYFWYVWPARGKESWCIDTGRLAFKFQEKILKLIAEKNRCETQHAFRPRLSAFSLRSGAGMSTFTTCIQLNTGSPITALRQEEIKGIHWKGRSKTIITCR